MLSDAPIIAFIPTRDAARARNFYEHTLGLRFVADDAFALVFESGPPSAATTLRVVRVPDFTPFPFTILGWQVSDVEAAVAQLSASGVAFLHFPGLDQTPAGIWTAPGGAARVAWFHDPDRNTLSLSQH